MKLRSCIPILVLALTASLTACERPPVEVDQLNYRGLGLETVKNPRRLEDKLEASQIPAALPPVPAVGPKASEIYQNVQVLGDLSAGEFNRIMIAMTQWVSPAQGCTYCHAGENLASDDLYTKVVARRMLQMTRAINGEWTSHVAGTGVTCYTCHRGQAVPAHYWFEDPDADGVRMVGYTAGQNAPAPQAGLASLPSDPFTRFIAARAHDSIRVQGTTALPTGNGTSIKDTEHTYALMMHLSTSLGVNCGYCHNSRSFGPWEASSPQRVTAWHGLGMVRDVNEEYMTSLTDVFPAHRKGPAGDVFKVNCATCHQGLPKPLNGVSMVKDYPNLVGAAPAR